MNPKRSLLRLLIAGQLYLILAVILMPLVIRWLPTGIGKVLYGLLVAAAVALGISLRRSLSALNEQFA